MFDQFFRVRFLSHEKLKTRPSLNKKTNFNKPQNPTFLNLQKPTYLSFPIVGVPIRNIADYSPFGVQQDGRTISMDSYRYGFQNQEKDDEIKGAGNSMNYKYRMHDPRVGRFFAVDPLAASFPHNSVYAFSENSTLAFIELEGLEKYFAADGSYLGCIGNDPTIRIVSDRYIEKKGGINQTISNIKAINNGLKSGYVPSKNHFNYLNEVASKEWGKVFDQGKIQSRKAALPFGKILDYIYNQEIGNLKSDLINGEIGIIDFYGNNIRGSQSNHVKQTLNNLIFQDYKAFTTNNENSIFVRLPIQTNNYYDVAMTLFHERSHLKGVGAGCWEEFKAHYSETMHPLYSKTSKNYKFDTIGSLEGYLSEQQEFVKNHPENLDAKNLLEKNTKLLENAKSKSKE